MQPVIGVTSSINFHTGDLPLGERQFVPWNYVKAIEAAGGLPVILPLLEEVNQGTIDGLLAKVDGLLFIGGVDIDPELYGQAPRNSLGPVAPERDRLEIPLMKRALAEDVPLLAICRGIQVMNVAQGGTLYQDLPEQYKDGIKHFQGAAMQYPSHKITIEEGSVLSRIASKEIRVNSFHHQGIDTIGDNLGVTAKAPDGIIETLEGTKQRFALGVQWHPEAMWFRDKVSLALFKELVLAAQ